MAAPVRWKLPLACSSLLVVALVLAGSALAGNGGIAPPGKSPQAERIRDLWWIVLGVTAVIFVIVEATLVMFVVKYRSRGRPREEEGPQIRGHTRLELIWTVIPVLIVAGDHRRRLLQAARDQGRAQRKRGGRAEDDRAGRRGGSSTGSTGTRTAPCR